MVYHGRLWRSLVQRNAERLRAELVSAARNDANIAAAAHTGSAALSRLDRWSDIDLALCLKPVATYDRVVADWTERFYQHHSGVAHVDVMRGATLFRVFLLQNTLQVDIAFWRADEFAAYGPNFLLIFGSVNAPQAATQPDPQALVGMAWLYALHVRSSLARGRMLQAEYMLSGMRNHVFQLMCLRCGVVPKEGRGFDDLPATERQTAVACVPESLQSPALKRALQNTMDALINEVRRRDDEAERRLVGVLREIAE